MPVGLQEAILSEARGCRGSPRLVSVPRIGLLAELSLSREMMSFDSSLDISLVLDLRDTVLCVTVNSDTDDSRF